LAWDALRAGGSSPCILNAANEVAVAAFIAGQVSFLDIAAIVGETLDRMTAQPCGSLDEVVAVDTEARGFARAAMGRRLH
jgi:1-deoxy-D-xylulose-5-phosphate reductoisomerase